MKADHIAALAKVYEEMIAQKTPEMVTKPIGEAVLLATKILTRQVDDLIREVFWKKGHGAAVILYRGMYPEDMFSQATSYVETVCADLQKRRDDEKAAAERKRKRTPKR